MTVNDELGRPLRDLRISVTDRCNFRCTYCMPAELYGERFEFLPKVELLTFEEITRLTRIFVGLGVRKIRITGGEPLLRAEVSILIKMLADIGGVRDLALTTNGYLLAAQASKLKAAGLNRVTVSLDSLEEDVFQSMSGREFGTHRVLEGLREAALVGLTPIKINTVIQRGVNDQGLVDIARYFKELGCIVRFIEYMDVGTLNGWRLDQVVPAVEILRRIDEVLPLAPVENQSRREVATRYRYLDGAGELGVITSVSKPFCGDCSRARLSADGRIYTCLFASKGTNLRDPMRAGASDDELTSLITAVWHRRRDRYSEERASHAPMENASEKIEMYQIGG